MIELTLRGSLVSKGVSKVRAQFLTLLDSKEMGKKSADVRLVLLEKKREDLALFMKRPD